MSNDMPPMANSGLGCSGCPMIHQPQISQILSPQTLIQQPDTPVFPYMMADKIPKIMVDWDDDDSDEADDYFDVDMDRSCTEDDNIHDINYILREIERNNPAIFGTFDMYGLPYPVARRLVARIIKLTLKYS